MSEGAEGAMPDLDPPAPAFPHVLREVARTALSYLHGCNVKGQVPPCLIHEGPSPFLLAAAQGREPRLADFIAEMFGFCVLDLELLFKQELKSIGGLPCPKCGAEHADVRTACLFSHPSEFTTSWAVRAVLMLGLSEFK